MNKENSKVSVITEMPTDWGGSTDCLNARLEDCELKILTVQTRLRKVKPGHKVIEFSLQLI
jgi:hypothetical protein